MQALLKLPNFLVAFISVLLCGCAPSAKRSSIPFDPLFSTLGKRDLRLCVRSLVQVEDSVEYEISEYMRPHSRIDNTGRPILPQGAQSAVGPEPTVWRKRDSLTGGATILLQSPHKTVLLTSAHLVVPRDTIDTYYYSESGIRTQHLFRRAILKSSRLRLRSPDGWFHETEVVVADSRRDIAVIESRVGTGAGIEFPYRIAYDLDLSWGDWVYAVGFPKGVVQLAAGVVSPSPYRGTLTLNAVIRFGFSGGAVLAFDPENEHLAFVGLVKSVPFTQVDVVVPEDKLAPGEPIGQAEIASLRAERLQLIEYGSAYFVSATSLSEFFSENIKELESRDLILSSRFLP